MASILVKDYMQANAQAVKATTSVREVIEHLVKNQITGVAVINDDEQVVGFVSEQDCIKEMLNSAFYAADSPPVTQIMTKDVLTVSPDASILEVAEIMTLHKPKNYPVVSQGKLVGLISRRHVLQALIKNDAGWFGNPH